ncbi:hypothetical protein JCM10450v2_002146 [Rhodotorula kratochvilovae]
MDDSDNASHSSHGSSAVAGPSRKGAVRGAAAIASPSSNNHERASKRTRTTSDRTNASEGNVSDDSDASGSEMGEDEVSEGDDQLEETEPDELFVGTELWTSEMLHALRRGLDLVPRMGRRHLLVGKTRLGRNGLIAEYIRRQTGQVRDRLQPTVPLDLVDWDDLLGPDLHKTLAEPRKKTKKRSGSERAEPSKRPTQAAADSTSSFAATVSSSLPQLNAPTKPSLDVKPRLPDHSFADDIRAFLTSLSPSHDFTAASRFLVSAGVSSHPALADLLLFEPSMLDALLETAQARQKVKLPALEMAWLKRVLALAREEMGAEG